MGVFSYYSQMNNHICASDCDDFPDAVIIGLRIEMSAAILNAFYKYRLLLFYYHYPRNHIDIHVRLTKLYPTTRVDVT